MPVGLLVAEAEGRVAVDAGAGSIALAGVGRLVAAGCAGAAGGYAIVG